MTGKRDQVSRFLRERIAPGDWEGVIEDGIDPELRAASLRFITAAQAGDLDRLTSAASPEVVIRQPPQIPDARTYAGHNGLIDALSDWPSQWADVEIDPIRTWQSGPGVLITQTRQRFHGIETGIGFEADFWFVYGFDEGGRLERWTMHTSEAEAEAAARG